VEGDSGRTDTLAPEYYVAAYEMTAILSGDRDPQVATISRRENYALETFEETRSLSGYLVNALIMKVVPDDYELSVTLVDRVSGNSHTVSRDMGLGQFRDDDWLIGGPEFYDPLAAAPDNPTFRKASRTIIPNVKRSFSGVGDHLAFFVEVDRDHRPSATHLIVEADQRTGRSRFADTVALGGEAGIEPVFYHDALKGLRTGETRLRLRPVDAEGREVGKVLETYFWIDWSVNGLVHEGWEESVEMLVHIARHGELKALKETPEPERADALDDFWKSRDPSPETPENEWKQEYYRRIRFANLQFANASRPGWRTDFGTVYVRNGEPDDIERYPFERDQKPYQIWFYYQQQRKFVFVDERGNGEYELQYPYDGAIYRR